MYRALSALPRSETNMMPTTPTARPPLRLPPLAFSATWYRQRGSPVGGKRRIPRLLRRSTEQQAPSVSPSGQAPEIKNKEQGRARSNRETRRSPKLSLSRNTALPAGPASPQASALLPWDQSQETTTRRGPRRH